jgi:RNA polymerase-binding transcription factor DksA
VTDASADPNADAAFLERVGAELDAIGTALDRLDDPETARCDVCGRTYDPKELVADPTRKRCTDHTFTPQPLF